MTNVSFVRRQSWRRNTFIHKLSLPGHCTPTADDLNKESLRRITNYFTNYFKNVISVVQKFTGNNGNNGQQ